MFDSLTGPVISQDRRVAPGLRFGDERTMALLACLLIHRTHTNGFRSRDLRRLLADALGTDITTLSPGSMTYRLRQLRLHGLIVRQPGTFRWNLTPFGLAAATAWTLAFNRMLLPGTAHLIDQATTHPLRTAYTRFADRSCLAA